jgi:hypothetical protein
MYVLRIEHRVRDYQGWKQVFDSDPVGREQAGVLSYRVLRPVDDPEYVMIDLEFEREEQAAGLLASLRTIWSRVEGDIMFDPMARITEVAESEELGARAASRAV